MQLEVLGNNPGCSLCELHTAAKSVCIPTRKVAEFGTEGKPIAVLMLASKPGLQEDDRGMAFVGESGQYVHAVYTKWLERHTNRRTVVFANNAVRCKPPKVQNPTQSHIKACSLYLDLDVQTLLKEYGEVVVLACGAEACFAVEGWQLRDGLRHQGHRSTRWPGVTVFATSNPAALLPGRDPSLVVAVSMHLDMVADFLTYGKVPMDLVMGEPLPAIPRLPDYATMASIDVETYGCVDGMPRQTCFHPAKMMAFDGVKREDLIVSAAVAWRNPDGRIESSTYRVPEDWNHYVECLREHQRRGGVFLGQNLPFDIMVIRAYDSRTKEILCRGTGLRELSIANFLNCDVRPERSLKEIAPLLRVCSYDDEVDLRAGERYTNRNDPRLLRYNALDCVATLECWNRLVANTLRGTPGTERFSPDSLAWFSDTLWTVIEMDEAGVAFDLAGVLRLDAKHRRRVTRLLQEAKDRWNLTLSGKGSKAHVQSIFDTGVLVAKLGIDPRLGRTEVGNQIKTDKENRQLLLGALPIGSQERLQIRFFDAFKRSEKLLSSYTSNLLPKEMMPSEPVSKPKRRHFGLKKKPPKKPKRPGRVRVPSTLIPKPPIGTGTPGPLPTSGTSPETQSMSRWSSPSPVLASEQSPPGSGPECTRTPKDGSSSGGTAPGSSMIGMAFPTWYPVPSRDSDDSGGGGTKQGRMTCQNPGLQTMPESVKSCMTSRWTPGSLLGADLSQIELRIAALLSGDPVMMEVYRTGQDLHDTTAWALFGKEAVNKPNWPLLRKVGKTLNFLVLYSGGPKKFQETLRKDHGMEMELLQCGKLISAFNTKYKGLREWQAGLVEQAKSTGYIELPFTGETRLFLGHRAVVDQTYVPKIVNFPVQAIAANVLKSAQREIADRMRAAGLVSLVVLNIYDALYVDGPTSEEEQVTNLIRAVLPCPPYYSMLQFKLGRELPLDYKLEVLRRTHAA